MISVVGAVFLALGLLVLVVRPRSFVVVLSASTPFPATAAVTLGGNSIPPFFMLAAIATGIAVVRWAGGLRVRHRALRYLAGFVAYSLAITVIGPILFQGVRVLDPRLGIDSQIITPALLQPNVSMAAQALYLVLGAGVALYVAQERDVRPSVLLAGFAVGTVLSSARLVYGVLGAAWPAHLFENYATLSYLDTVYQGARRHKGIFPEPSYLAVFSISAIVFFVLAARVASPRRRLGYVVLAALALGNVALSYSGTAVFSALVLLGVLFVRYFAPFFFRGGRIHPFAPVLPLAIAALLLLDQRVLASVRELIEDKIGSQSFGNRSTSDVFSLALVLETRGIGVGLGANRPSSFITMLLSCAGVIGFVLFAAFLWSTLRSMRNVSGWQPTLWALLALLLSKSIAEPALSTPMMWLSLGVCLYAGRPREDPEQPAIGDPASTRARDESTGRARAGGMARGAVNRL